MKQNASQFHVVGRTQVNWGQSSGFNTQIPESQSTQAITVGTSTEWLV